MLSPSALPFSSVCVCQHEPKLLFCGKQSWKWGSKTQLCSQPGPGATCWFAPQAWEVGAGPWLLSGHGCAMTPSHSRSPLPKQQPRPLPGCQILLSCGGWSCGHLCAHPMAITSHRQFSLCLATTSLLIYGLVLADKSQTCNIQFFPRLSGRCLSLCHQWRVSQVSSALSLCWWSGPVRLLHWDQ